MAALRARSTRVARVRVRGAASDGRARVRWACTRTRGGDGRVCVHVGGGVGDVVRLFEQANGQGGCNAGEDVWGDVAGVGEEGALSLGSWCILNGCPAVSKRM